MIAIATSLLFGLAATMAMMVVWLSLRSGIMLGMALLRDPEPAHRGVGEVRRPAESERRAAIFPVEGVRAPTMRVASPLSVAA